MEDLIKSSLFTGIGAIVIGKEKFKDFVEELIQNNELTQDEGRRVINNFINQAEDRKTAIETSVIDLLDQILMTLKMPPRNELEVKFNDFANAIKNQNLFGFLKKELDLSPTVQD